MPAARDDSLGEAMLSILDWYDGPLEGYAWCQGQLVHYLGRWSRDAGEQARHDIFYALTALPREAKEPAAQLGRLEAEANLRDAAIEALTGALCDQLELARGERVPTMWATMRWGEARRVIWSMIDEATFLQMTTR